MICDVSDSERGRRDPGTDGGTLSDGAVVCVCVCVIALNACNFPQCLLCETSVGKNGAL